MRVYILWKDDLDNSGWQQDRTVYAVYSSLKAANKKMKLLEDKADMLESYIVESKKVHE